MEAFAFRIQTSQTSTSSLTFTIFVMTVSGKQERNFIILMFSVGIIISNNSKLEDFKAMNRIRIGYGKGCTIQVSGPPNLDFGKFCDIERFDADYETVEKSVECGELDYFLLDLLSA